MKSGVEQSGVEMGEEECPRWYVKVRYPASEEDPRALLVIPGAFLAEPTAAPSIEIRLNLMDAQIGDVFERIDAALKTARTDILRVHLGSVALRLNRAMQVELHSGLAALQVGAACDCQVETLSAPAVQ